MSRTTPEDVRVLHAVRVMGFADLERIAERAGLDPEAVQEHLLDAEARGWTTTSRFAGEEGWSLTESGKAQGERLLSAELDDAGARSAVEQAHLSFLLVNDDVAATCTAWQLSELGIGAAATLDRTLDALRASAGVLAEVESQLALHLRRFAGYHARFATALHAAEHEPAWITGTDRDSCHRVWFELHEDLIATLGMTR